MCVRAEHGLLMLIEAANRKGLERFDEAHPPKEGLGSAEQAGVSFSEGRATLPQEQGSEGKGGSGGRPRTRGGPGHT